jgi:hypothetical protein
LREAREMGRMFNSSSSRRELLQEISDNKNRSLNRGFTSTWASGRRR